MATFYESALSAFNKDAAGAVAVTNLAKRAVKLAYSRNSLTECQNMLDLMTKNYKDALPRFFKRAGISVIDATVMAPAIIGSVLDKSKQAKVFAWLDNPETWVVNPEDVAPRAKVAPKDIADLAEAKAKVQSMLDATLKRLKDNGQENLAMLFQERIAGPKVVTEKTHEPMTFVTGEGHVYELDMDETEAVLDFLLARQVTKSGLAINKTNFEDLIEQRAAA